MAVKRHQWWRLVGVVLERREKERRAGRCAVEDGNAFPFYRGRGGGQLMVKAEEWLALMGDEMASPLVVLYSVE
jgi:hypothetical protein